MIEVFKRADVPEHIRNWTPRSSLGFTILKAIPHLPDGLALELIDRISSSGVIEARLALRRIRREFGVVVGIDDFGVVSHRVVTDAGVAYLVDAMQNLTEAEVFQFHGIGSGTAAEAAGNTALATEFTTQYDPDNTRATGTRTESAAATFRTVGTNTVDAGVTVNEHAVFSQAATGGGTMLDRSMFSGSPVGLNAGDSLQSTYDLSFTAGG